MAQFNLADYETVEERLKRAHAAHTDLRIVTVNHTTLQDRSSGMWVIQARIYLSGDDQAQDLPKATGWAFEIDGTGMANKTSALENCETSAIGRALANMNLSGNKRTSREEMAKVERGVTPALPKQQNRAWLADAQSLFELGNIEGLLNLYSEAQGAKASKQILDEIAKLGNGLRAKNPVG
jgi:hypothetical protein